MAEGKSVKANRINVENLVYALMLTDTKEGCSYGPVKELAKAMQIQTTPSVATGTLYGEGVLQEDISRLVGIAVVIDANKVPIENRAEILGNDLVNGQLWEKAGDEAPDIAVGYKVPQTKGKAEYVWLLKGTAKPMNDTAKQSEGNITFSNDQISINFKPREYDKQIRVFADSAFPEFTDGDTFLNAVPTEKPVAAE